MEMVDVKEANCNARDQTLDIFQPVAGTEGITSTAA